VRVAVQLTAPEPLNSGHRINSFDCGEPVLDEWLRKRALGNQASGASRTFVVADASSGVMGYYASAAGAVAHETATCAVRRNMADPVPVLILGRLAVDRQTQGVKLGAALLQDAVKRAIGVSADAGIRALLVNALSEQSRQFNLHYGFPASALHPMTLMMRLPSA
jgi:GNAT superfamily N-acetyltransferase